MSSSNVNKFKRYVHGAGPKFPTHKDPKTSPLQLTPVQRRAQARVKLKYAKKDRLAYLDKLEKEGFRSPEHYERFQATRNRTKKTDVYPSYSWNDSDPDAVSSPQKTIAQTKQEYNQNKELDEVEILDTMQLEFLDHQQQDYVSAREHQITMFKRIYEMMEEDFRSQIIRVQREAANIRLEMKECLQKRKLALTSYTDKNEKHLKQFDAWYENFVKLYAAFTERRIEDWENVCSLQHKYRNKCNQSKISCSESLVNGLGDEVLSIRHYGLGDAGANVFLATSLRSNKFLCILDLSDNFLTDAMAFTLASAITPLSQQRNEQKSVDQSQGSRPTSVKTTVSTDSRKIDGRAGSRNSSRNGKSRRGKRSRPSSKQSAYLIKMNEIKEKRKQEKREKEEGKLVKTEPLLSSLKSIDLSKNLITGVGFSSIIAACSGVTWHPKIHGAEAMASKFGGRSIKTKLGHMISSSVLTRSCPLEMLNLSCNKIGDHPEAEFSIEVFLSNDRNSLTQIDMSYNELGPKVGKSLGKAMRLNQNLKECNFRWNDFAGGAAKAICNSLRDNGVLISLDLSFCSIDDDAVVVLAKVLSFATSKLIAVHLGDNKIGPKGCRSLCRVLKDTNRKLKLLDLCGNSVREDGIIALSSMLKVNDTLCYMGFDIKRAGVKLGEYESNNHQGPPGSPKADRRVIRAIKAITEDHRIVKGRGIDHLRLFNESHTTKFLVAPKWIDGGVADAGSDIMTNGNFESVRPTTAMSFASISSVTKSRPGTAQTSSTTCNVPARLPFVRALYYDLRHTYIRDLRDSGDKERVPKYPNQPFIAAMVGDEQHWDEELSLCMFPGNAIGGPKVLQKQKGLYADEFVKYECTVSKVSSIEGPGIRYSVKKLFLREMETTVAPGSRLPSRESGGWKSKFIEGKKDPVVEETVSMAVLAREDDYEDEYNQVDEWENETPPSGSAVFANLTAINAFKFLGQPKHSSEDDNETSNTKNPDASVSTAYGMAPGEPPFQRPRDAGRVGRMRTFGLEFTWPCKFLPAVEVGNIVCFTFKPVERRKKENEAKSVEFIKGLRVNRVERYGVVEVDVENLENSESDDDADSSGTYDRRTSTRGTNSTRASSRG
eukprot:g4576.t1